MAISMTLQEYLKREGISFELAHHRPTFNSASTAEAAHVPGDNLAKGVLVDDGMGYLLAVIPATHRLNLEMMRRTLHRPVELAAEGELGELFPDCAGGAVPALGSAFGLETVVDQALLERPEIWLEAGDHEDVVHLSGASFRSLMGGATRSNISTHR